MPRVSWAPRERAKGGAKLRSFPMTADTPIRITPQQAQEHRSLPAIQEALLPWTVRWMEQGQDFGRDGFVQIVDADGAGGAILRPLTLMIQCKSHSASSAEPFTVPVQTNRLKNWIDGSTPLVIVVWSTVDGEIGYRSARAAAAELDRLHRDWRAQAEVGIRFRTEDVLEPGAAKEKVKRWVADESDVFGGADQFHRVRRRVLLTDLFNGTGRTSETLTATGEGTNQLHIVMGTGWRGEELDPRDIFAPRVLAGALILYEQVFVPLHLMGVVRDSVGPALNALLAEDRIVPVAPEAWVGFRFDEGATRGQLSCFGPSGLSPEEIQRRAVDRWIASVGVKGELADLITRKTHFLPRAISERVAIQAKRHLTDPRIRAALGLTRSAADGSEPVWDRYLVNRILHVNEAIALGNHFRIDVVEYEGGLGGLAAELWHSELRFDRLFPSLESFQHLLDQTGVPDLGLLEAIVGLPRIAALSATPQAQEFRDWFWDGIRGLSTPAPLAEHTIQGKLETMVGEALPPIKLAAELKLLFFGALGEDYLVGTGGLGDGRGFATRAREGQARLRVQREVQASVRKQEIAQRFGSVTPYGPCPCASGEKFRFCCGPKRRF